ncbi:3-methyladenine DNA glycosylase AlkD [Filimonas lacunae]|uniref:3-methyladenine DNA glycosylase AlkD n=1 Tax=Filimonas lacunae TaxID=477680 RepID=A0A173MKG7_9BACT|nr:DNA alkylation repair protein [Filimonas lacunae]BAV07967.1 DNA alkylation repair enzyme [Filimonas lacunae]SIT07254.1 3-methyladenine DNA glycosylase AlkD [Filimonas lacunae]
MKDYVDKARKELQQLADAKTLASAQKFFKEPILAYGVKTPDARAIAKSLWKECKQETKATIFGYCEQLWQSGYVEESVIACEWSYSLRKQFEAKDMKVFEKWIQQYVNNWSSCDNFCNNTVGALLTQYPEHLSLLTKWATSSNRWMRRAAAVSLILPARNGLFLTEAIDIATQQLHDTDDLVQKGYGWLLKVASKHHEKAIFRFIMTHKQEMPRTALRYAIELMPAELKAKAMSR